MTVTMALVDFIPVVLFLLAALLLQRDLYNKMSKGCFALFAAGTLMIFLAGGYKALWKLLYALGVGDVQALNQLFFPMQTTGFVLAAIALIALLTVPQGANTCYVAAAALPVLNITMVFVVFTVLGTAGICGSLAVIAARMKKKAAVACFGLAFVFMLAMGYLSSRDFTQASMHWIAQFTNIFGQGFLLAGTWQLHKAGLGQLRSLKKVKL